LFTSRAVADDACGVIAVTEDNHLTKTHRNLTKIVATILLDNSATKYDDFIMPSFILNTYP
jgi:hypothetical protein